jgi:formimidoylglutamate deiminase
MTVLWAQQALTEQGWQAAVRVTLDHSGRIQAIKANEPPSGQQVGVLLPAPSNAHSHAFQRAMAGLTERRGDNPQDSFWTWRQLMYRFLDRLTPDHIEAITAFVQMEMLEAGYACNVEFHYLHHQADGTPYPQLAEMAERIVAAAAQSGIGLTLLPVHYQVGGCDGRPLGPGQRRFGNPPERFAQLYAQAAQALHTLPADARMGVAPHSLRAVPKAHLAEIVALSDGPIHLHLAEQQAEVDEVLAAWGQRPVQWLLDHADVDPNWCLIHCTQMLPKETLALAQTGAVAGLCPTTEGSLGDGIFDGVRWLNAGGRIALGSDSNIRITLSEELRLLEYSQRLRDHSRAALASVDKSTGRRLFDAICQGGAQAAGRTSGSLRVGAWADLLALDYDAEALAGRSGDVLLDRFIFTADDRCVTDVWAAGRHQVRNGRHIEHDAITRRYRAVTALLEEQL